MNMKKTIAAAAAGAMAVSATATAASAATATSTYPEQGSYSYSLVKNFAKAVDGTATVVAENRPGAFTTAGTTIYISLADNHADYSVDTGAEATLYIQDNEVANGAVLFDSPVIVKGDNVKLYNNVTYNDANSMLIVSAGSMFAAKTDFFVRYTATVKLPNADLDEEKELYAALVTGNTFDIGMQTGQAATSATILGSTTTALRITSFTKYNPVGKTFQAPLLSNTNTNRYDGGVPNIIAYLEGYNDNYNGGWFVDDSANFPVANTGALYGDTVQDLDYLGRVTTDVEGSITKTGDYLNVAAVLNDVVANRDVAFTFLTATQKVWDSAKALGDTDTDDDHYLGAYDADGNSYGSFNQHLYGLYGNDPTYAPFGANAVYFGNTGLNYNLFQGGLIVNDTYTMQLANTEVFSYSLTTISFKMSDIEANALANYNSWLDYIQSLRLATSTEWYWDNLTIEWTAMVEDTVATGEGLGSDEVTLDDEPAAGDDEVVAPTEEVPVAPNPATGNSAVALAVIPVALAAAAIVAKKRK